MRTMKVARPSSFKLLLLLVAGQVLPFVSTSGESALDKRNANPQAKDFSQASTSAKVSTLVCLYVPPNLPTCDFERSNNSGEGVDEPMNTLGDAFRRTEAPTSSSRSMARRSLGRNVIIYVIEGCVPSSIPNFIPACEGVNPADRIVELRKLYPFTTKDSSGPTLRFPKFNHDKWMRGIKRLQQREYSNTNSKDQQVHWKDEVSVSNEETDHRTSQFISVAKRNAMMPKTTMANRYVSKGSLPSRSMAQSGSDPLNSETSSSWMPSTAVDTSQNELQESSVESGRPAPTIHQMRLQGPIGQRRHQNPSQKKSLVSNLQKSQKPVDQETISSDLEESINRIRRSLVTPKESRVQQAAFDSSLNDLAGESRETSNRVITPAKGRKIAETDLTKVGSDNLENALDSSRHLHVSQKTPEIKRKRSKVNIDTVFPYSKAIPLKNLGDAGIWRELFHSDTDPFRSRMSRNVEESQTTLNKMLHEKLPRRKNSLSFSRKPSEIVGESRRRIDDESSSKGNAWKPSRTSGLGSKSMPQQSRDVVSPKRGLNRYKKISRKGLMGKSATKTKSSKMLSKRSRGSRKQ